MENDFYNTITKIADSRNKTSDMGEILSVKEFSRDVRTSLGANRINHLVFDCFSSLSKLENLPEDHEWHLRSDVARIAARLLAHLAENYDIDVPMLLPENDECIALTWDSGVIKKYLAVYGDAVDLTLQNKHLDVFCHDYLCDDGDFDFDAVGRAVSKSGHVKNTTSV